MNEKKLPLDNIITDDNLDKNTLYFITPASEEELKSGNFLEAGGVKISNNPKKHAIIKNVTFVDS